MKRITLALVAFGWLALAPATMAFSPGSAYGFAGSYVAMECATWWEERPDHLHDVDCSVWGDGSLMTLSIGRGTHPIVTQIDSSATFCANEGLPLRHRAVGYGTFVDDNNLEVTFIAAFCGTVLVAAPGTMGLYGPEPTLWNDPDGDGWGTVWYPTQ